MKTTQKRSDELKLGDIVHVHGARMRLAEVIVGEHNAESLAKSSIVYTHAVKDGPKAIERYLDRELTLRSFRSEFVGNVSDYPHSIPASWLKNWTIQGNKYAMWSVEI